MGKPGAAESFLAIPFTPSFVINPFRYTARHDQSIDL
jgi:hypothetical protein